MVAQQRVFLAMVSHEFRTPLAVIDGAAQVAQMAAERAPLEVVRHTDRIRRGVRRLLRLLDTWLTQDRIAARIGRHRPRNRWIWPRSCRRSWSTAVSRRPGGCLSCTAWTCRPPWPWTGTCCAWPSATWLTTPSSTPPRAAQWTWAPGPERPRWCWRWPTTAWASPPTSWTRPAPASSGPGMPAASLGWGLGLHLTARIAELHRGRMELDSEEGAGTPGAHPPAGSGHRKARRRCRNASASAQSRQSGGPGRQGGARTLTRPPAPGPRRPGAGLTPVVRRRPTSPAGPSGPANPGPGPGCRTRGRRIPPR